MKYERFNVPCDLSWLTLAEAIHTIGVSQVYELHVSSTEFPTANVLIADHFTSKLPVRINVTIDPECEPFEWFVSANGRSFGSPGA